MKRGGELKRTALRPRCKHCKRLLGERERGIHSGCVDGWYAANREKIAKRAAAKKARGERESFKARKQAAKRLPDLIAELQVVFNAYIRARDAGKPCICCGKPFEPQKLGGSMDAGHYLARSIAPQHRFNENNVFGQRKNCNRPGGATRAAFRAGVIDRIGLQAVEALEADSAVHKWQRDELIAIKAHYRAKRKELISNRTSPEPATSRIQTEGGN